MVLIVAFRERQTRARPAPRLAVHLLPMGSALFGSVSSPAPMGRFATKVCHRGLRRSLIGLPRRNSKSRLGSVGIPTSMSRRLQTPLSGWRAAHSSESRLRSQPRFHEKKGSHTGQRRKRGRLRGAWLGWDRPSFSLARPSLTTAARAGRERQHGRPPGSDFDRRRRPSPPGSRWLLPPSERAADYANLSASFRAVTKMCHASRHPLRLLS